MCGRRIRRRAAAGVSPGDRLTLKAVTPARVAVIGGAPLDGKRFVWWNFVSSRKERIRSGARGMEAGRFGKVPGDEIEFIRRRRTVRIRRVSLEPRTQCHPLPV